MSDSTQQYMLKQQIRAELIRIFSYPLVTPDGQFAEIFAPQLDQAVERILELIQPKDGDKQ